MYVLSRSSLRASVSSRFAASAMAARSCMPSLRPDAPLSLLVTKIKVTNPVVEMDGDEMTRIIWAKIRDEVRLAPISRPPSCPF